MVKFFTRFTDSNEKQLKRLQPVVDRINELEPGFEGLSDPELRAKTAEFKARLKDGVSLDDLLPEAFAAVREAAKRTIGQRHYDVQLIGGIVLHQGKIAEMRTGEGKTLVATLPLYLNSLGGQGCHLATVNDYLARRDPYWMAPVYSALGVSVASIYPQQNPDEYSPARLYDPDFDSGDPHWTHFRPVPRAEAYRADITYGTSSEFGFDYLRDNMVLDLSRCVQRHFNYVIVDEVDNLLIDEARTPLIISGPDEEAGQKYHIFAGIAPRLRRDADYEVDEKERRIDLTDAGYNNLERMLQREGLLREASFYDPSNADLHRHLRNALSAKELYKRDQQYVVKDGQVIIVDEFTGRLMWGRRYAEGLHQAIEAKEHIKVQQESRTFATITIQHYFKMYSKLAGMTGTALTEAEEFSKIYSLDVIEIPTHRPMIRKDYEDIIYKDEKSKFKAVVREIEEHHKQGRPVLAGTVSIEKSEELSEMLKRKGIVAQVLNAKLHEKEAGIITDAGRPGAVTVATNMAGRGVDIVLGGKEPPREDEAAWQEWQKQHDQVVELGGLHVVATERHEARRIDNQLRGRAGRQGDPGSSRFYVSLEDDIVRRFGGDRVKGLMEWAGMDEDTPIENRLVNKAIGDSQRRVEGYHFDMRKHLVEYDEVVNQHRELIYKERRKILGDADLRANIMSMVGEELRAMSNKNSILDNTDSIIRRLVSRHFAAGTPGPEPSELIRDVSGQLPLSSWFTAEAISRMGQEDIEKELIEYVESCYERWSKQMERGDEVDGESLAVVERFIMPALLREVAAVFPIPPSLNAGVLARTGPGLIGNVLSEQAEIAYQKLEGEIGVENMRMVERRMMLHFLDRLWIEHLTMMEDKRREAGWQSLRQVRSLDAYKNIGYEQFQDLLSTIRHDVVHSIFHVTVNRKDVPQPSTPMTKVVPTGSGKQPVMVKGKRVGRNEPCPCGSGKKYKHCCGR
ncbi:MAG: preprotein translocase subunit SecA [Dehalococcoidales bacterium]|nr:preprotein translocase subunit SecA [Dehalococcoidales bacterium]